MIVASFLKVDFLVNIMVWILNYVSSIVGNYGLAIIITTFLIRIFMLPLTLKQEKSMKRMKELQPKLDALKTQYADDKQMLNQKTAELYQKEKVNPAAGCLPLLIQLPIFIALFYAFSGDSIPGDARFLWFTLSEPDKFLVISGFAINLLPILTTIVTLVQQKLMQASTSQSNDATASTMNTMMYTMPLLMLFLFYKMPSGLNLYYFINSLLSVLQQAYVLSRRD